MDIRRAGELVQLFHTAQKCYLNILNGKNVLKSKNNLKRHAVRAQSLANQLATPGARKTANAIRKMNQEVQVRKGRFTVF